jgi:MOSC domain-containing protein YiiM
MEIGTVEAVCVVHRIADGYYHPTAIDKRPVAGPVQVGELGPEGDRHVDSSHGGLDAAVYVYADEDAAYVSGLLDLEVPPGLLGEPGRGVLLEVCKPRTPCRNLSMRVGIDGFHLEFNRTGRSSPA